MKASDIERQVCRMIRAGRKLPEVPADAPQTMRINLGCHEGRLICELPTGYLRWLVQDFKAWPHQLPMIAAAKMELERRERGKDEE